MADKNATIAKNTLFLSIRMVFVLMVSLYTSRVFLNTLGIVDYGISNVVAGFVSMFGFLNTSLANGIQRFYNSELGKTGKDGVTKVYNTSLVIQSIIALVVFIFVETFGLWYLYEKMVIPAERFNVAFWLFQFSTVSSILVIIQTPFSAAIMAYEKMDYFAFVSILDVILKLGLAIVLPYLNADHLLMYGLFVMLITLLSFFLYWGYSKYNFKELHLKKIYSKGMFKEMISFSGWNLFGTFACMIREQGLNMLLNLFFGPVVNAARGVAYQVSGALQGLVSNLGLAAKPQMIQSYATGDPSRTIKLMYAMSKISFIFLLILAVPIILNINYILHIWLGKAVPEHSAAFIMLIILANFMNNLNAPLSNVVYAIGEMRNYEITFSIINLMIIPLSYVALRWGAPAETAFIIYFIMAIFVQFGCLLVLKTLIKVSMRKYVKELIFPMILMVAVVVPISFGLNQLMSEGFLRVIVEFTTLSIISCITFYFVGLNNTEKDIVKLMIQGIIIKFRN